MINTSVSGDDWELVWLPALEVERGGDADFTGVWTDGELRRSTSDGVIHNGVHSAIWVGSWNLKQEN